MYIASQVAPGMAYLVDKNIIYKPGIACFLSDASSSAATN
jgi:hypothetical protein